MEQALKIFQIIFTISSIVALITATGALILSNKLNDQLKSKITQATELAKPNTLRINLILKVNIPNEHVYSIKFTPEENKPFNQIKIVLIIPKESKSIFTGLSGMSSYTTSKNIISEDKKTVNYKFSILPGSIPQIGFQISEPTKLIISGNYGLKEQTIELQ